MENPIAPRIPPAPFRGDDCASTTNSHVAVQEEEARLAMALRISDRFHLPIERVYRMLGGSSAVSRLPANGTAPR